MRTVYTKEYMAGINGCTIYSAYILSHTYPMPDQCFLTFPTEYLGYLPCM